MQKHIFDLDRDELMKLGLFLSGLSSLVTQNSEARVDPKTTEVVEKSVENLKDFWKALYEQVTSLIDSGELEIARIIVSCYLEAAMLKISKLDVSK